MKRSEKKRLAVKIERFCNIVFSEEKDLDILDATYIMLDAACNVVCCMRMACGLSEQQAIADTNAILTAYAKGFDNKYGNDNH